MSVKKITYGTFIVILTTAFCLQYHYAKPFEPSNKNKCYAEFWGQRGPQSFPKKNGSGETIDLIWKDEQDKQAFLKFFMQDHAVGGLTRILHILTEFFNINSLGSTSPVVIKNTALSSLFSNSSIIAQSIILNGIGFKNEFYSGLYAASRSTLSLFSHGYFGLQDRKKLKNAALLADFYKKNPHLQQEIRDNKSMLMLILGLSSLLELCGTIGSIVMLHKEQKEPGREAKNTSMLLEGALVLAWIIRHIGMYKRYQAENRILAKATSLSAPVESKV